jgi:2-dehydropantoate 2-reductase
MRILVVGAGAVGGYFGGRLVQAGRDVTFLVLPKRAEQIQSQGLQILSPMHGDFIARPKTITASQIASPYDVIFLSVKSYSLAAAIDDFAPAVGQQTEIIPVLNGMHHMDVLTQRFGDAVLGGVCFVSTAIDSQGRIVQLADFQSLAYGELDGKKTSRIEAVHQEFSGAGFQAAISGDILRDMWQKWVFLASLGAITCLLRGNIGEIVAARHFVNAPQSRVLTAIRCRRHSWQKRALNLLQRVPNWPRRCIATSQNTRGSKRTPFLEIL